jgi:hypothetical protein
MLFLIVYLTFTCGADTFGVLMLDNGVMGMVVLQPGDRISWWHNWRVGVDVVDGIVSITGCLHVWHLDRNVVIFGRVDILYN